MKTKSFTVKLLLVFLIGILFFSCTISDDGTASDGLLSKQSDIASENYTVAYDSLTYQEGEPMITKPRD